MYVCVYIYIYIYIYIYTGAIPCFRDGKHYVKRKGPRSPARAWPLHATPSLHNKIPAQEIFARVWVAQESIVLHYQR